MNMRQGSKVGSIGVLGPILEKPLFFGALAIVFFAGATFTAKGLIEAPSIEARIHTEIIDLDAEAEDTGSLLSPSPFDAEGLKQVLLSGGELAAKETDDHRENTTWHDHLTVRNDGGDGEFIIVLGGDDALQASEKVNGRLQAFTDQQNRRRAQQKTRAALWIEQKRTAWQARIDEAKAAIVQNPFDPALPRSAGRSESAKLLHLMIDATIEAQTAQQASNREAVLESEPNDKGLATETARLTEALRELEAGRAVQLHHGKELKEAEAGLATFRENARELMREDGILDRPAATILMPAAVPKAAGLLQHFRTAGWQILLPALAIASLLFALIGTLIACRFWPPVEVTSGDHLNDPHWPLPPDAHRELST